MTGDDPDAVNPGGPIDVATLRTLGRRARGHPLVEDWAFRPDAISPRSLEIRLDSSQYPATVESVRLDVRWYEGDQYTVHYVESHGDEAWQCRWDRHPKPDGPMDHFHPPPDADGPVTASDLEGTHHLEVLFAVLEWLDGRLEALHDG